MPKFVKAQVPFEGILRWGVRTRRSLEEATREGAVTVRTWGALFEAQSKAVLRPYKILLVLACLLSGFASSAGAQSSTTAGTPAQSSAASAIDQAGLAPIR